MNDGGVLSGGPSRLALTAASEDFMPVPERLEMVDLARFRLDPFDLRPLDFEDAPAVNADQMVVMGAFVFDFKFRHAVGRGDPLHQPSCLQCFQHPEHRHPADAL